MIPLIVSALGNVVDNRFLLDLLKILNGFFKGRVKKIKNYALRKQNHIDMNSLAGRLDFH